MAAAVDTVKSPQFLSMFLPDQYELLDFGEGRRLERFGAVCLDRPCEVAVRQRKSNPALWAEADSRFERSKDKRGHWVDRTNVPERWTIKHGSVVLELKRNEFGHLGVFPEQAANWDWLAQKIKQFGQPVKILNLFAYTGGSTLTCAAAGAQVVHVDAAENVVSWARRNAQLSGLQDRPVRWICEDAVKFVKRELRRGNQYDAVILDPPSYGHGPHGEVFRLSKHLRPLLEMVAQLTQKRRLFVLLTAHTPKFPARRLAEMLRQALGEDANGKLWFGKMTISCRDGRQLPSGDVVRWWLE